MSKALVSGGIAPNPPPNPVPDHPLTFAEAIQFDKDNNITADFYPHSSNWDPKKPNGQSPTLLDASNSPPVATAASLAH